MEDSANTPIAAVGFWAQFGGQANSFEGEPAATVRGSGGPQRRCQTDLPMGTTETECQLVTSQSAATNEGRKWRDYFDLTWSNGESSPRNPTIDFVPGEDDLHRFPAAVHVPEFGIDSRGRLYNPNRLYTPDGFMEHEFPDIPTVLHKDHDDGDTCGAPPDRMDFWSFSVAHCAIIRPMHKITLYMYVHGRPVRIRFENFRHEYPEIQVMGCSGINSPESPSSKIKYIRDFSPGMIQRSAAGDYRSSHTYGIRRRDDGRFEFAKIVVDLSPLYGVKPFGKAPTKIADFEFDSYVDIARFAMYMWAHIATGFSQCKKPCTLEEELMKRFITNHQVWDSPAVLRVRKKESLVQWRRAYNHNRRHRKDRGSGIWHVSGRRVSQEADMPLCSHEVSRESLSHLEEGDRDRINLMRLIERAKAAVVVHTNGTPAIVVATPIPPKDDRDAAVQKVMQSYRRYQTFGIDCDDMEWSNGRCIWATLSRARLGAPG
jgi:hypothetical protein